MTGLFCNKSCSISKKIIYANLLAYIALSDLIATVCYVFLSSRHDGFKEFIRELHVT